MNLPDGTPTLLRRAWTRLRPGSEVPPRSETNAIRIGRSNAAPSVQDGDVLLWRGTYFVSRIFELLSWSWYSHAAFILHWEGRPLVMQAGTFGIQAVPFLETVKKYHGLVDLYPLSDDARARLNCSQMLQAATDTLGEPFGLLDAVREVVYRFFGLRLRLPVGGGRDHRGMFCAEYVAKCFRSGGLELLEMDPHRTFPDDICHGTFFTSHKRIYDEDHVPLWARRRARGVKRDEVPSPVFMITGSSAETPVSALPAMPPPPAADDHETKTPTQH